MTYAKCVAVCSIVWLLSACVPEKSITEGNALQLLQAKTQITQISQTVSAGFNAQRSLQRAFAGTGFSRTTTNISDTCKTSGDYLFSLSDSSAAFSVLFNDCSDNRNQALDGTLDGNFTSISGANLGRHMEVSLTGNLVTDLNGGEVVLNPLTIEMKLTFEPDSMLISQRGNFLYNSDYFSGVIKVETLEAVGSNLTTGNHFGITTYTDEAKNVLRVEHDNNGVHLYLNNNWFNSFSHSQWLKLW